jgi:phosphatidylglycerol:prolipoprotein diacylglycerol transferase
LHPILFEIPNGATLSTEIIAVEVVLGVVCLLGWLALRARAPTGWAATALSTGAILVGLHFALSWFMKGESIKIYTFGVVIIVGFLAGIRYLTKQTDRLGIPSQRIFDWGFWLLLTGIIGSRLLYVLLNADEFEQNKLTIFAIWNGGLVWYGGLIPAVVIAVVLLARWRLPVLSVCDAGGAALMLALGIGRWACLLAGDDYGKPTDAWFGICFNSGLVPRELWDVPLHPTQLYMSVNALWLFFILDTVRRRAKYAGQAFALLLILYATTRAFLIEPFRGDFVERNPSYAKHLAAELLVERADDGPAITLARGASASGGGRTGRLLGGYDPEDVAKGATRLLAAPIDVVLPGGQKSVRCWAISDGPVGKSELAAFHRLQWPVDRIEGVPGVTVRTLQVRPYKSDLPQPPGYVSTSQWISVGVALAGIVVYMIARRMRQPGFAEAVAASRTAQA